MDIGGAVVGLGLTLPLYPAIALAIRLDSPGPVFFRQRRAAGLQGRAPDRAGCYRSFPLVKFRTMRVGSDAPSESAVSVPGDSRITNVGRFLRKSRLDELPQLWNVLRGEMSLVGPRPEQPSFLSELAVAVPLFEERLRARPGLTGLAQVQLGYTGSLLDWSSLWGLGATLRNPFDVSGAEGALADDMRTKLLYDLAYIASLESFTGFLRTDLGILLRTPLVMVRKLGE